MRKTAAVAACLAMAMMLPSCKKGEEKKEEAKPATTSPVTSSPAAAVAQGQAEKGALIFQQKCVVCHKVKGSGGEMGPDLSDAGKKHDAVFLQTQIENPATYKKDTKMPPFKDLPKEDMDALIAYLLTLK